MNLAFLLFLSFMPAVSVAVLCVRRGEYDASRALRCLAFGLAAVLPAALIQFVLASRSMYLSGAGGLLFRSFAVAALVEESLKFAAVFFVARRGAARDADRFVLLSGLTAALSFAAFESLVYALRSPGSVFVRFLTAVVLHAASGIVAGAFVLERSRSAERLAGARFFLAAVGLHGLYNTFAVLGFPLVALSFAVLVAFVFFAWSQWSRRAAVGPRA